MFEYTFDYENEEEFNKLERALKKYNMLAFKKLNFEYYPALRNGNFVGTKIEEKNGHDTYELALPTDQVFEKIHGKVKLVYTVVKNKKIVILKTIIPTKLLLEGHLSELTSYKGVLVSSKNASKDMFKINLLNMISDKPTTSTQKNPTSVTKPKTVSVIPEKKKTVSKEIKYTQKDINELNYKISELTKENEQLKIKIYTQNDNEKLYKTIIVVLSLVLFILLLFI